MIGTIISSFIMVIIIFTIWNSWSTEKIKWFKLRTLFIILGASIVILINYFNIHATLKAINTTIILILIYKILFDVNLKNSLTGPIITQIIYMVSESVFALILMILLKNNTDKFINNYFGSFIANTSISFCSLVISKIPIVKKLYYFFDNATERLNQTFIIFLSVIVLFIYGILTLNTFSLLNPSLLTIFSLIISIISFVFICLFFKTKNDYYKVSDKYNSSLVSLRELENVLTNHRIDNHENKNQLMTIRNMTTSKKIIKFIDTILDNKLKDDKNIMHETSMIPSGGLRGLIYSKLLLMKNKNIDYDLELSSSVRLVDLLDYGEKTMLDICKIIGIFLDNAIEEVDKLNEKYIIIEMYNEDNIFNILITNIFDTSIKKDDIYKAGVSTKGGNHGYGLSLVKKLVKNNSKLRTHHEINSDEFTQVLQINR